VPDTASLCLMAVHAHPDDESTSGGIFSRYAAEGVRTALVTCTLGEEGEIVDPTMDVEAVRPRLGAVRMDELRCSVAALGIEHVYLLAYRDSGMAGTAANANPLAFTNADVEAAAARLVAIVRAERPQVLVTYDEQGGYGHPDHIMAHRIAVAAYEGAGDPTRFPVAPGQPGPWEPSKVYYIAWPRERMYELMAELERRGLPNPFADRSGADDAGGSEPQQEPTLLQPESAITTTIDVAAYFERKMASVACHRSQFAESSFFRALPPDLARRAFGQETFILARSRVPTERPETDLFAGLR
jgi:mycothiol conjugate amidase Mca